MSIRAIGSENIVVVLPTKKESVIKIGDVELLMVGAEGFDVRSYDSEEDFMDVDEEAFEALSLNDSMMVKTEGTVVSVPWRITFNSFGEKYGNEVMLEAGDYVYFHHNVTNSQFDMNYDGLYWSYYEMFFAKKGKDGVLWAIGDNCLALPVKEEMNNVVTSSGIWMKTGVGNKFLMATLTHMGQPREGSERRWWNAWFYQNDIVGRTIIYSENSDIKLRVDDVDYFRMKVEDIVAIILPEDQDQYFERYHGLRLQNKYVMIEQFKPISEVNGIIIPESSQKKEDKGIVFTMGPGAVEMGIDEGDEVYYYGTGKTDFEWGGKAYILISADYIYCKN